MSWPFEIGTAQFQSQWNARGFIFIVCCLICNSAFGHDVAASVFGARENFETFGSATEVIAERTFLKGANSRDLSNYARGPATTLSEDQVHLLHTLFSEPTAYAWNHESKNGLAAVKACLPNYGLLLTFHAKAGVLRIALSFPCNSFAVFAGDANTAQRVNSEEDLDRMRPVLIVLAQALFPNDAEIQSLK